MTPPIISPITISPYIPIRVVCLPDSVSVPSLIFLLPGYSSPTSTLSSTFASASQTFSTISNATTNNLPDQNLPYLIPRSKRTPILGSFSISPQTLSDSHPSNFSSLDMLPPLSSSIVQDQIISSCSFAPSIVVPPSNLTSSSSHNVTFPQKSRGGCLVKGKLSQGHSPRGRPPKGGRENSRILPCNLSFPQSLSISSQRYFSKEGVLDLSTKSRVCDYFPHTPSVNPYFTNYSCSPKIFSPIVSFNEPSEYVFNMFSLTYSCDFFPG